MSEAAEAARRLGAPIFACAECGATGRRDVAIVVATFLDGPASDYLDEPVGDPHLCSIYCVDKITAHRNGWMRAYRWHRRQKQWVTMGIRGRHDLKWSWNDTGEARWIEENAARLRAAGEIS